MKVPEAWEEVPEPEAWEDEYIFNCELYKVHIYYKPNNDSNLTVCDICKDQLFHYVLTALNRFRKVFNIKVPFFFVINEEENVKDDDIRTDMSIQTHITTKEKKKFYVIRIPKWTATRKAVLDWGAQLFFAHEIAHVLKGDNFKGLTYEKAHDKKYMDIFLKLVTTLLETDNNLAIELAKKRGWNEEYGK